MEKFSGMPIAVPYFAQDIYGRGVEGLHEHELSLPADHLLKALLHLVRRLVGEGHRHDRRRRHVLHLDEICDAVRYHARLAGARARENEKRAVGAQHGSALGRIEFVEKIHELPAGRMS